MIAHRGGYDFDEFGENTIPNIMYTACFLPEFHIEIDIYFKNKRFVVCHDPPKNHPCVLLDDVLRTLHKNNFKKILFLDVKCEINTHFLFDLLYQYDLKYYIHCFDYKVYTGLRSEKINLPFALSVGFASEKGEIIADADYLVFPKDAFQKNVDYPMIVYWYTFDKMDQARQFLKNVPEEHDCFVDYCIEI